MFNGKIYVFGGSTYNNGVFTRSNTVDMYDPATDTWTTLPPMPIRARSDHTSTEVNGKIYIIGGSSGTADLDTVVEFNPTTNTWTTKASMPYAQTGHLSVAAGGWIWVISGENVYAFDVAGDSWYYGTPAYGKVINFGRSASGINDKIYVIGGLNTYEQEFSGDCLQFDLSKPYGSPDAWTYKKPMNKERRSLTSAVVNGKIYAIGGFNYNGYQRVVQEYDPVTDTWTTKRSMMTPRERPLSAVVNGKIYVIGGRNDTTVTLATVEEYDPANDN